MLETQGRLRFAPFDALVQGVAVVCESGQVVFWNRWLERWSGVARADALARPLALSLPQLASLLEQPIARALRGESGAPLRWQAERPPAGGAAAERAVLRLRVAPIDAYDVARCALLTLEDLADWRAPAEAPAAATRTLEAELASLRARIASREAQLRRQTELLLRHARELSLASAAVEAALSCCELEQLADGMGPGADGGTGPPEGAQAARSEAASGARRLPWANPS